MFKRISDSFIKHTFISIFSSCFLFSCSKEEDQNTNETDPVYLQGLLKRVEFYGKDTISDFLWFNNSINFSYDSLRRPQSYSYNNIFWGGTAGSKSTMFLHYASPTTLTPEKVVIHDSAKWHIDSAYKLDRAKTFSIKYDNQGRKIADTLRDNVGNFSIKNYKYFTWTNYKYYSEAGLAGRRIVYDLNDNFLGVDYQGEVAGELYTENRLAIDSLFSEDSPLYFNDQSNPLNNIFKYQDFIFNLPWGFSTLGFDPYYFCKKIPKGVNTVYRSSLDYKLYTSNYFFSYEKENGKVIAISILRKSYRPNNEFAGTAKGVIKFIYYK